LNNPEPTPVPRVRTKTTPRLAHAGPEAHLGEPRCVGVVEDDDRALERHLEGPTGVEIDPTRVDVGSRLRHAVDDDAGHTDPDRDTRRDAAGGLGGPCHGSGDGRDDPRRGRWFRRHHPQARRHELALRDIDNPDLDPAATDVDADRQICR
jgi:hypothetical protein